MVCMSILLAVAVFSAFVAADATSQNPDFEGIDSCAYNCLDSSLAASPISKCAPTDTNCQCAVGPYTILTTFQACLVSTNACGNNRFDPLQFLTDACDTAIANAASASAATTGTVVQTLPPSTVVVEAPTPTDLAAAESQLASASPGVDFTSTSNLGSGNSNTNTQDTSSGVVPIVGTNYHKLSGQAIAGIAFAVIVGACIFFMSGFCYLERRKKKARKAAENGEGPVKFTGDPVSSKKKWFTKKTPTSNTREIGAVEDDDEIIKGDNIYYGHDKEMNYMANPAPMIVVPIPGARSRVSMITTDVTQLTPNVMPSIPSRGPSPEPPLPVPSASPQRTSPPRMSLTYATKPQRPSVSVENPVIVFPQATVTEYSSESARNSQRYSQASMNASNLQPNGLAFNMNIIPATPQMNGASPISPSGPKDDIFNYYSDGQQGNNEVGMAQSTEGNERRYTYQQHAATNSQSSQHSGPSPSIPSDNRSRPYTPEPPTTGLIMPPRSARSSSRSPSPQSQSHSHAHNLSTSTTSTSIFDQTEHATSTSTTINRGNSQAWRASVERAADRAMDRVRHSRCEDVPEDKEYLTKKPDGESEEDGVDGRGRSKWRTSLQDMLSSNATVPKHSENRSMSVSPAPSARSGSNSGSARSGSVGAGGRDSTSSKRAMERRQSRRTSGAVMMV